MHVHVKITFAYKKYIWIICAWKIHFLGAYLHEKYIWSKWHEKYIWGIWAGKIYLEHMRMKKYIWSMCARKPSEKLRFTRKLCQTCLQVAICEKLWWKCWRGCMADTFRQMWGIYDIKCWKFKWKLSHVDLNNHLALPHVRHVFNFVSHAAVISHHIVFTFSPTCFCVTKY